jgi:hypothetical protein
MIPQVVSWLENPRVGGSIPSRDTRNQHDCRCESSGDAVHQVRETTPRPRVAVQLRYESFRGAVADAG